MLAWRRFYFARSSYVANRDRGGGASEQLGGEGSGGHAPPGKFSNLHAMRLNLEYLEASETKYSDQWS